MANYNIIIVLGFCVVLLGILLIFIGTALQSSSSSSKTEVHTAGVIMIGPIPVIFGNDRGLVTAAVIFTAVLIIISYFVFYRRII